MRAVLAEASRGGTGETTCFISSLRESLLGLHGFSYRACLLGRMRLTVPRCLSLWEGHLPLPTRLLQELIPVNPWEETSSLVLESACRERLP